MADVETKPKFSLKNLTKTQKILGIVGILVVFLGLCAGVAAIVLFTFVFPPSARRVCNHAVDLAVEYYQDEWDMTKSEALETVEEVMGTVSECEKDLEKAREDQSLTKQREVGKCVLNAETFEDMVDCALEDVAE